MLMVFLTCDRAIMPHTTIKTIKDFIFDNFIRKQLASTRSKQMLIETDSNTITSAAIYT